MGKTALVRNFLDQIKRETNVMALQGRCYERESVPYKALDGVVDNLSKHLTSMRQRKVAALLPRDVPALARDYQPRLDQLRAGRVSGSQMDNPLREYASDSDAA